MEINNTSNDNVEQLIVKLVRCFVAHSENPRHDMRYINEDLTSKTITGVGAHGQQTYDVNLQIPHDLAVPNMVECQLIESIYRLEVTASTSGLNRDLNFVIAEIKVGHIEGPLESVASSSSYPNQSSYTSTYIPQTSGYPYPPNEKSKNAIGFEARDPSAPPAYNE